ncbi:hypothetical protein [Arcicella rigui]|uniref:Uncharacterized protein n=1 Tax=Arcicella rigui TaxID=797020 RepID=A0ABU5QAF8_9BACT|nr:hypothetical protein [Arcicella rigui]MEA5139833.1 hypothetical protein [Arcicella rigui]
MSYNGKNYQKTVDFIMNLYDNWKVENYDRPDTYFLRVVLKKYGHFLAYCTFMNYKTPFYKKKGVVPSKEYWEQRAFKGK